MLNDAKEEMLTLLSIMLPSINLQNSILIVYDISKLKMSKKIYQCYA